MNNFFKGLAPAIALSLPLLAGAQTLPRAATTEASQQPLRYESAFADYKPWQDIKPGNWRQLNDALWPAVPGKAGGHPGHSASSDAPASSASAPAADSQPNPQHKHPMHGGKP